MSKSNPHLATLSTLSTPTTNLITDAAHIVVFLQVLPRGVLQTVYLGHGRPSLTESAPATPRLAPDVEVGVDEHHDGPDGATALEDKDPATVEEEEYSKAELHSIPEGLE